MSQMPPPPPGQPAPMGGTPAGAASNKKTYTILAYLFFFMFLAHFGAILFHTLIVRDGILKRMAPWNIRETESAK